MVDFAPMSVHERHHSARCGASGALRIALCVLLLVVALAGCGQTSPRVSEPPSTELDEKAILDATEEAIDDIAPTTDLDEHLLARLKCEVKGVKVGKGGKATATVHVSNVDLGQALEDAYAEFGEDADKVASIGELYREGTDDELWSELIDVLYKHIDSCKKLKETDVDLKFHMVEGSWSLDEDSAADFAHAAYPGLS